MTHRRAKNGGNDDYYTNPHIARQCVDLARSVIDGFDDCAIIEPSAGGGVFLDLLPHSAIGYDVCPRDQRIKEMNFFDVSVPSDSIVIGNPPFGFAASLAIKFFNHAANAKAICFILPRSFQKDSVKDRLNRKFHLLREMVLPKNSFLVDGEPYDVPCVFQVWIRSEVEREPPPTYPAYIEFCDAGDAQFAIRRVGGRAGKVLEGLDHNKNSTYFVRSDNPNMKKIIESIDFSAVVCKTAGVRSISKHELLRGIHEYIRDDNAECTDDGNAQYLQDQS